MKKTLLLLLSLVIAGPSARADTQSVPLHHGINYIGAHVVNFHLNHPNNLNTRPAVAGVSANTITFGAAGWVNLQQMPPLGPHCYTLEHPASGYWDIVTARNNATRTLTLGNPWPYGTAPADRPIIRRVKTLHELFSSALNLSQIKSGTGGTVGTPAVPGPAGTADRIWVPDGLGTGYKVYFHNGSHWRRLGVAGNFNSAPVYFIQGMIYERTGVPPVVLGFSGAAVTSQKMIFMGYPASPRSLLTNITGIHIISSVFGGTTGSSGFVPFKTLDTCGLTTTVHSADQPNTADEILIPQVSGSLKDFFHYDDGTAFGWLDVMFNDASNEQMDSAFLYKRKIPTPVTHTLVP